MDGTKCTVQGYSEGFSSVRKKDLVSCRYVMYKCGIAFVVILFWLTSGVSSKLLSGKSVTVNATVSLDCGRSSDEEILVNAAWVNPKGTNAATSGRFQVITNGSLLIKNVSLEDDGRYTCNRRSRTASGLTTRSINVLLDVNYPPKITSIQSSVIVYENKDANMPCEVVGNPGVNTRWLFSNGSTIKDGGKYELSTNGSLVIRHVKTTDVMKYICAPYNEIGSGSYGYTDLLILVPPKFLSNVSQRVIVIEAHVMTLDCTASGIPTPNITWEYMRGRLDKRRTYISSSGLLVTENMAGSDVGEYVCHVQSDAGKLERHFEVTVIGKPGIPYNVSVISMDNFVYVTWTPSYNGGSTQDFEIWHRDSKKSDFEWDVIFNNASRHQENIYGHDIGGKTGSYHYFSIRAKNAVGYSDFSPVVKSVVLTVSGGRKKVGEMIGSLSDEPLEPFNFTVNISTEGYNLTWKYMNTPGRPTIDHFSVQYRTENSTNGWQEFTQPKRLRRSASGNRGTNTDVAISADDVDLSHPLEFQVSSVSKNNVRSKGTAPTNVYKSGMPSGDKGNSPEKSADDKDDDLVPAIVLGVLFGVFLIIFSISLYCFCRRKKRCQARKILEHQNGYVNDRNGTLPKDCSDAEKLLDPQSTDDSPRRFHVRTCPALKLGKSSNNNNGDHKRRGDDVYFLVEPNSKEKLICTCSEKYLTLGPNEKKYPGKVIYKSSSSPSVLLPSDLINHTLDATQLLADEDYDVSELEEDNMVAELERNRIPKLERLEFKDSYDQFCQLETNDSLLKDILTLRKHPITPLGEDQHVISSVPSSVYKDIDVSSSEASFGDSEKLTSPKLFKEPIRGSKSSEEKSSGYGDGDCNTSSLSSYNFESFVPIKRFVSLATRSDIGYCSDTNSSHLSPLDFMNRPHNRNFRERLASNGNMQYFSEDEAAVHRTLHRPEKPPSYSQAIVDIERYSEKSEKTESEKSFEHLLEMEKQLGVRLDDGTDENDLPIKSLMTSRFRHSIPRNYFSDRGGTLSDVQSGMWKDKYTNREKTLRCNQLLEEFKISKMNNNIASNDLSRATSPVRPYSLTENIILEEESPPENKRRNSSTSTFNEWLV